MTAVLRRDRDLYARPMRQLCVFVLAVMLLTQVALAAYAWSLSGQRFFPALERKAHTIGQALAARLTRAIDEGASFGEAAAVGPSWDSLLVEHPDIAYLALTDTSGKVLHRRGTGAEVVAPENYLDTRTDIVHRYLKYGQVHVGVERRYFRARLTELRYDLAVVLIASLLIAFEALWFIVTSNFSAPMRQVIGVMSRMAGGDFRHRAGDGKPDSLAARLNQLEERINHGFRDIALRASEPAHRAVGAVVLRRLRARYRFSEDGPARELPRQRVVTVRILTFLFVFAELLLQPVLPLYAGGLPDPLRAALPLSVFLLGLILALPAAGRWSDAVGRRRSYASGALLAAGALACAGLAPHYAPLLLARAAAGAGCALMLASCQGYVHDNADRRHLAMLAGAAAMAASCAPAVGGMLADRIDAAAVFIAAALVALLAAGLGATVLDGRAVRPGKASPAAPALSLAALAADRHRALALMTAMSTAFLYAGVMLYLAPLSLAQLGASHADSGRYAILAGLGALLAAPLFASLARRANVHAALMVAGSALSGLGLLAAALGAGTDAVLCAIAALALGQSMSIPAILTLPAPPGGSGETAQQDLRRLGMLAGLAAAAGPLAGAALAAGWGAAGAMLALGIVALAASLLSALGFVWLGRARARIASA